MTQSVWASISSVIQIASSLLIRILEASRLSRLLLYLLSDAPKHNALLASLTTALAFVVFLLKKCPFSVALAIALCCCLGTILTIALSYSGLRSRVEAFLSHQLFSRIITDTELRKRLQKLLASIEIHEKDVRDFLRGSLPEWYLAENGPLVNDLTRQLKTYSRGQHGR